MIALKVKHKGKTVVAGNSRCGMVGFNINLQCFDKGDELERGYAKMNGFYRNSPKEKPRTLCFLDLEDLQIGDQFVIEICDVDFVDAPIEDRTKIYKMSFWEKLRFVFS